MRMGTMRGCRTALFGVSAGMILGMILGLSACSTVQKTFDFSADPELQKTGQYPNINITGAPQPGRLMTADQQEQAKTALKAAAASASPDIGAAAKAEGAKDAAALSVVAKTHAAAALHDIESGCVADSGADATKCPQ